jgi:hypothetical protein
MANPILDLAFSAFRKYEIVDPAENRNLFWALE